MPSFHSLFIARLSVHWSSESQAVRLSAVSSCCPWLQDAGAGCTSAPEGCCRAVMLRAAVATRTKLSGLLDSAFKIPQRHVLFMSDSVKLQFLRKLNAG